MKLVEIDRVWARRFLWLGIGITLTIFLVNFSLVGFGVYGDGIGYYTPLRSLIFDGNLKISDEYEYLSHSASNFGGGIRVTKAIPEYSKYTLGMGLVLSPFFALGHLATLMLNALGIDVAANGLTWPYELFYCLGSIGLGIAGLILCYKGARRFFSPIASMLGVASVWFASPLAFYLSLEVSMSHAVSQFLISAFLYLWVSTPWMTQRRQQILLGLILGLAALVRPQDVLFMMVPILTVAWVIISRFLNVVPQKLETDLSDPVIFVENSFSHNGSPAKTEMNLPLKMLSEVMDDESGRRKEKSETILPMNSIPDRLPQSHKKYYFGKRAIAFTDIIPLVVIGLVTCLMQMPQWLIYQWQYGSFSNIPYLQEGAAEGYQSSFNWGSPEVFNVLFSGFHGLFSWHPVLFLSIVGLVLVRQKFPMLTGILLVAFALQVYLVASWWCWWQGASFGGRMFSSCSFIFVMGLAAFWDYFPHPNWKRFGIIITFFLIIWNGLLGLQYESGMIPPEDPVTMGQILRNQLFVIPYFLNHIFNR